MEGTIGEIRIFSGNYAPLNWSFCQGQVMPISNYETLFTIIGTTYGGDGQQTFNLPDLRSRTAMGAGQGPGLTPRFLGQSVGTEAVALSANEMPAHTHPTMLTPQSGPVSANATLYGVNGVGGQNTPGNNYIGQDTEAGASNYVATGSPVKMNANSISVSDINDAAPNISLAAFGGSQPHTNIQPVLAINFIICLEGIYPTRN